MSHVATFRALHVAGTPLVMPNPWDLGSARMLAAMGARAVATTSAGHAFTLGRPDMGHVGRDEALEHAAALVAATGLPVNGDFENGYGREPEVVAETVRLAAKAGLAGLSIEDTDLPGTGAYPFDLAVARIEAAVAAAREADIVLTARADGWMNRAYDDSEVMRRAEAFARAGAEVLYAPLIKPETVRDLCRIGPPVNVLAVGPMARLSVAEIGALGVARISIGGALARVTHKAIQDVGRAILDEGDLSGLLNLANGAEIDAMLTED